MNDAGSEQMDRERLNQVEVKTSNLEKAMEDLTKNVTQGFTNIQEGMAASDKGLKDEIGKLYGRLNNHALQDAQKGQISWPLVISIIGLVFVAAHFFQASIQDGVDRTVQSERELRQSQNQNILLKSQLLNKEKATP